MKKNLAGTIQIDTDEGDRIDRYLAKYLPLKRNQIKRALENYYIEVNGNPVKSSYLLRINDEVIYNIPQSVELLVEPTDTKIEILYQDNSIVIVNKPAGIITHPADNNHSESVVSALLNLSIPLSYLGGEFRPGIVHRLDKDTSGVMVVAKTDEAYNYLREQFNIHSINRAYVTIIHGIPKDKNGTIDCKIGRSVKDRKKISPITTHPRRAVSHYELVEEFKSRHMSLLRVTLETGRTHQIRVHMKTVGFAVVADATYGFKKLDRQVSIARQALHAQLLGFKHPESGEYIEFTCQLPEDMASFLDSLRANFVEGNNV